MGWTGLRRPPGLSDREFFEQEFPTTLTQNGRIVACATVRSVFYAAVENNANATYMPSKTWALVVLMQRNGGEFCYKEMSEDMGPCESCAPAKVLNALSPTDIEWANNWRERCRMALAKPKIKSGDRVKFSAPIKFTSGDELSELTFVKCSTFKADGRLFRVSRWKDMEYSVAN